MLTSGNTILITGGGSGIGLSLLRELYSEGNSIIVAGRKVESLQAIKKEFPKVSTLQCDLLNPTDVDTLLDMCKKAFKSINVFVGNAGIQQMYARHNNHHNQSSCDTKENIQDISPLRLIYGLIPLIRQNSNSAIVLVSHGQKISDENSPIDYRQTEKSIQNFCRWLRTELTDHGVEVWQVVPPLTDAQLHRGDFESAVSKEAIAKRFILDAKRGRFDSNIGRSFTFKIIRINIYISIKCF